MEDVELVGLHAVEQPEDGGQWQKMAAGVDQKAAVREPRVVRDHAAVEVQLQGEHCCKRAPGWTFSCTHRRSVEGGRHQLNERLQAPQDAPHRVAHQLAALGHVRTVDPQFICPKLIQFKKTIHKLKYDRM